MDFLFLSQTALFRGCSPRETADMLQCLRAERRVYEKDRVICHAGDTVEALGLVLSGGVNIESVDVWGSRSILGHVGPGQVFAETYACLPGEPLMVDAVAAQRTEVLFLNTARLLRVDQILIDLARVLDALGDDLFCDLVERHTLGLVIRQIQQLLQVP